MQLILIPAACVITVGMFFVFVVLAVVVIDTLVEWWSGKR
jgi:hypothetical protein